MRFRTKLFLAWSALILLLWAGTLWPLQRTILSSSDRMADSNFAAMRQSLGQMQAEEAKRRSQAGSLVMSIPELRALIAENNSELNAQNAGSLQERLDGLADVLQVNFLCALDARGELIAQNSTSPWAALKDLSDYISQSPQARPMVRQVFGAPGNSSRSDRVEYGLWVYNGQLYQVVGFPLVFDENQAARPDGALILATPLTNDVAGNLAFSHGCEISFIGNEQMLASSLGPSQRTEITKQSVQNWPTLVPFDLKISGQPFRSYVEPLIDPCSKTVLGSTLIQTSMVEAFTLQKGVSRNLLMIMTAGLAAAALFSFLLSNAVSRPVRELVKGVRRVAEGNLETPIQEPSRDELGELALAFNDMMAQMRTRRDLQRLVEQSQAANRAKSQFLANMSHEIRTPLHGIIGLANLLLGTDMNDRQRHYTQLVRSSTEVLATLINDILDFSKIEAGKLDLESVEFDLHTVIEDVVELISAKAQEKGLEIASDIAADVPVNCFGDPTRLRQILLNLINNSVKFTERGQVVVRVRNDGDAGDKTQIRFAVIDSGIGIPPDRMDRLFKSFSQVDASTTRKFGGTGLGLAISKQLIELMGGNIGVESELGHGSTFWFKLALKTAPAQPAPYGRLFAGTRALVVDDNPMVRVIIRQKLIDAHLHADAAADIAEARECIDKARSRNCPYALLLVDGGLPDVTSVLVERDIVRVLLSNADDELAEHELKSAGFSAAVVKPVRESQLLSALASALGKAEPRPVVSSLNVAAIAAKGKQFRILVAEDNEVNRIVAADFLNRAGFQSLVVPDGQAAVRAAAEGKFDLILMDCQMPVMDGFEATRAIRQLEQARRSPQPLPIIALTANASGADRSRCLEAGMNAYCSKPFRPQELLQTIASFLSDKTATAFAPTPEKGAAPAPIAEKDAPLKISAFLERCTGNSALAMSILEKFEKQVRVSIAEVQLHLENNNGKEAARVLHAMKGTAGIVEADALRLRLADLEQLAKTDALDSAEAAMKALKEEIARCEDYLPRARSQLKTKAIESAV